MQLKNKNIIVFSSATGLYGGYELETVAISNLISELGYNTTLILRKNTANNSILNTMLCSNVKKLYLSDIYRFNLYFFFYSLLLNIKYVLLKTSTSIYDSPRLRNYFNLHKTTGLLDKIIQSADLIYMIGQPKDYMANMLLLAEKFNKRTIYHEITQLEDEYVNRKLHKMFVNVSDRCSLFIGCSLSKMGQMIKYFKTSNNVRCFEQWSYLTEKDLLKLPIVLSNILTIGIISRLSSEKRVLDTLKVIEKLLSGIEFTLVIAGDGPEYNDIQQFLNNSSTYQNRFKLMGYVEPKSIVDFYSIVDIIILSSNSEGGPITGMEAMCSGKLIISSDVGAMKDRISHGIDGYLFDKTNLSNINQVLGTILKLEANESLSIRQRARMKYLSNYRYDKAKINLDLLINI